MSEKDARISELEKENEELRAQIGAMAYRSADAAAGRAIPHARPDSSGKLAERMICLDF